MLRSKALIEESGYSREYAPALSNKLHSSSALVKINNAVCKPLAVIRYLFSIRNKLNSIKTENTILKIKS